MCGQSGSGKTYSLGLVLEQLLLGTSLRMIILDPNSDYIRLSEVRDSADLLMRMNSEADLAHLRETFSFVPAGLIQRATTFRQGESLVAGKFTPHPTYVRFGQRISQEGGADIPTSWAAAR